MKPSDKAPKVSVIIATYNYSSVLRYAIATVLWQTFRDFELIVVGDLLSYDPYGIMFRRNDPQLNEAVLRTFRQLVESRDILELYHRWFVRRTPTGEQLNLPMSPQLEESLRVLGLGE